MPKIYQKYGFTLVELIVAIAIMAILSSLGLASFVQFNRRQVMVSASRMVISDLRLAQSKAYASEKPSECGENSLTGYWFNINDSGNGYLIIANCPPVAKTIKTAVFSQGIMVTDGFTKVFFKALRQGLDIFPTEDKNFLILNFLDLGLSKKIIISEGGEIYQADEGE